MLCCMPTNDVNDLDDPNELDELDDQNDQVRAAFEACATFAAEDDGSPVCAACGWLGADHEPEVAPKHARSMPRRSMPEAA
jgi:hypothetical protein